MAYIDRSNDTLAGLRHVADLKLHVPNHLINIVLCIAYKPSKYLGQHSSAIWISYSVGMVLFALPLAAVLHSGLLGSLASQFLGRFT